MFRVFISILFSLESEYLERGHVDFPERTDAEAFAQILNNHTSRRYKAGVFRVMRDRKDRLFWTEVE